MSDGINRVDNRFSSRRPLIKRLAVVALLCSVYAGNAHAVPEVIVDDDWAGTPSGTQVQPGYFFGSNAFDTVTSGVEAVDAGGTVTVRTGFYNELLVLNKPMTLRAGSKPVLQAPPGSPAGQALVTVNANNVTINGFEFRIDQTSATHGIRAANPNLFDNLTITDNEFIGTGPYVFGTAAVQLLGNASAPFENVTVRGNVVSAQTVFYGLSRGVFVRDVVLQAGGPNPADGNQIGALV